MSIAEMLPSIVEEIASDTSMNWGIRAMRKRKRDFNNELEMMLTGISRVPEARRELDKQLQDGFKAASKKIDRGAYSEVIIGGGLHAAIYAASRVQSGFPRPLIIERDKVGGIFAHGEFNLNSRNRAGDLAEPGQGLGLNVLPGAPIQLANLSAAEFQTNQDLAFVIRCTIAMYADVLYGEAVEIEKSGRKFTVKMKSGDPVTSYRVLDARGLSDPKPITAGTMSFVDFMKRLEQPFPFQGWNKVAVIGDGDSSKVVVEALLGSGPANHTSIPALDWIEQVDWYAPGLPISCETWRETQRGRYLGLGSFLNQRGPRGDRLRIFQTRGIATRGFNEILVNELPYDAVIAATGWLQEPLKGLTMDEAFTPNGVYLARTYNVPGALAIGPRANLPFSAREQSSPFTSIQENRVALFRLGRKTATLAVQLPDPVPVEKAKVPRVSTGLDDGYGTLVYIGDRVQRRSGYSNQFTGTVVGVDEAEFLRVELDEGYDEVPTIDGVYVSDPAFVFVIPSEDPIEE